MGLTVNPIKLETGSRPNSAGIPYILLLERGGTVVRWRFCASLESVLCVCAVSALCVCVCVCIVK